MGEPDRQGAVGFDGGRRGTQHSRCRQGIANRELPLVMHISVGGMDGAILGPRRPMLQGQNRDDDERWR